MEEEKAAAYYDELTRKGEGAAKFKQGLGFSSSSSDPFSSAQKTNHFSLSSFVRASSPTPAAADGDDDKYSSKKTSSLASISNFVRASSPKRDDQGEDHARVLDSIHGKLNRRRSPAGERDRRGEKRGRRDEDDERCSSRKSRDRDRDRHNRDRERSRRRSRSYSPPPRVSHGRDRDRHRDHSGDKDRSSKDRRSGGRKSERPVDYEQLIEGYSKMTAAERVKAKMKLQLSQTAAKDAAIGVSSGWERFDFNKEAPLDDDEDATDTAGDDLSIVKDIGRSFRFSAVEARREEEVKAAHDQAMFGGGPTSLSVNLRTKTENEDADDIKAGNNGNNVNSTSLISDKVLSTQQGSWRDRARRHQNGSEKS